MEAPATLAPAGAEIGILMNVRLIEKDQEMAITLSPLQQALQNLHKGLPPLRAGPPEQLLGLLPQ